MYRTYIYVFIGAVLWGSIAIASHKTVNETVCAKSQFPQVYKVFDAVFVCAAADVPTDKVLHAVHVTAEWLDNDNDGTADAPRVIESLHNNKATLVMTDETMSFFKSIRMAWALQSDATQGLYTQETNPPHGQRDASQEEIHHLIMNYGWGVVYPHIFSESHDSQMFKVYKNAEKQGHYSYDDPTCTASCKSTEFHYLGMAAYLGATSDLASDEMRIKTRKALMKKIPDFITIIESSEYNYPKHKWPTGYYPHTHNYTKVR